MTSLRPNIVKRIDRLPKPKNVAAAMQPLFEAISNAIHSVQNRFEETVSQTALSTSLSTPTETRIRCGRQWKTMVLASMRKNWDAFTETDTDNKISIGGKGVGRLCGWIVFRKSASSAHIKSRTAWNAAPSISC